MHHFFERNIHKLCSQMGRQTVLDEMRQIAQEFQNGDQALQAIYEPLYAKFGVGLEEIEREMQRMQDRVPGHGIGALLLGRVDLPWVKLPGLAG